MTPSIVNRWKERARRLKREVDVIYLACKDPRSPWYAKVTAACVIGYACSPIDLIPDCIPVLGYLDDLIIVPLGIILAMKMIPPAVLAECREQADKRSSEGKPVVSRAGAVAVIVIWLATISLAVGLAVRFIRMPR